MTAFGVCQSILTGEWLVPGYAPDGRLCQLYRWAKDFKTGKRLLLATPGLPHAMHRHMPLDQAFDDAYVCEGWGDACALYELLRAARWDEGRLVPTGAAGASLAARAAVIAVPGCTVFPDTWAAFFAGKRVTLLYDSDHPRGPGGSRAGWDGARRAAGVLAGAKEPPAEIRVLQWGPGGHDASKPSGWDLRDALRGGAGIDERLPLLQGVFDRVIPAPAEWVSAAAPRAAATGAAAVEPAHCDSWPRLLNAWQKALAWRQMMEDVLVTMLAVGASTDQAGDQLFLQVIGDAGSAKTRFCDAMLVSRRCHSLEHLTGFHSGWKGEEGEDCSLIARINHKTLITPEGDTMMSSPHFAQLMSQTRRIFDGTTGATFKNSKEDRRYTGLRTPWIMAGTPALLDKDQARLGDRFLRVVIERPTETEEDEILSQVFYAAAREVAQPANGVPGSTVADDMLEAYRLTGGYVDYLRAGMTEMVAAVEACTDKDWMMPRIVALAKFAADMRARPDPDPKKHDAHNTKELPSRLTKQLARLAFCAAVVKQKRAVDDDVLRLARKVALDTSRGKSLKIAKLLYAAAADPKYKAGVDARVLAMWLHESEDKTRAYVGFLAKIGVARWRRARDEAGNEKGRPLWALSERSYDLYQKVVEGKE